MKKEELKPKKKFNWKRWIPLAIFVVIGALCGFLATKYVASMTERGSSLGKDLLFFAELLLALYVCMLFQIIIHEAGHLVFGLLSGYKFTSFRIGSMMWILEDGELKRKRFSLAGTGGQCLMSPPDLVDGKMPYILFNMGGAIMNLIASLVCGILWFLFRNMTVPAIGFMMLVLTGLASAAINGIPMKLGNVDNDGYNALSLGRNEGALYAFWLQMKVNGQINEGMRLKDMPEEWFILPSNEEMKNSMVVVRGVFACNRLMDAHRFEEADELMEHLLSIESGMVGVHRYLMVCDRIYCELIGENRKEVLEKMMTKELDNFMKSMKTFPSVIRTEYAYDLLSEGNEKKAEKKRKLFEKVALKYPYPSDIQSEQELMELANLVFTPLE